jgi:hypothetical protein
MSSQACGITQSCRSFLPIEDLFLFSLLASSITLNQPGRRDDWLSRLSHISCNRPQSEFLRGFGRVSEVLPQTQPM